MANAFTRKPILTQGGIGPEEWNARYVYPSKFQGDVPVEVVDHKGVKRTVPHGEAALLFRNPKSVRGCSYAFVFDVDVDLLPLVDAFDAHVKKRVTDGRVTDQKTVLIPLGAATSGNAACTTVLRQSAREWVSGGANNADMSDQNVTSMYMHALGSLVFMLSQCKELEQQKKWFTMTALLMESVSEFCKQCEEARKIIAALRDSELAEDMLQRSLAFAFAPPLPKDQDAAHDEAALFALEDACRILEVAIKRNSKHGSMMVAGAAAGPMSCLVLVPLLRNFLQRKITRTQMNERFNQFVTDLATVMSKFLAGGAGGAAPVVDPNELDTAVVGKMLEFSDVKIASDKLSELIKFCREPRNYKVSAPLEEMKLVIKPKLSFPILHDKIRIKNGTAPEVNVLPRATAADLKERKEGEEIVVNRASFRAKKPTEWSAVGLLQDGCYTFTVDTVGVAEKGVGSVLGKELQSVWRVTSGQDIMPNKVEGYSSAGMQFKGPGWKYDQKRAFSLDDPCELCITGGDIVLTQDANRVELKRCDAKEPVLLAFKNLTVHVNYKPLRSVASVSVEGKKDDVAQPAQTDGDDGLSDLAKAGLTPVALLDQMSKLAIATSKKKHKPAG